MRWLSLSYRGGGFAEGLFGAGGVGGSALGHVTISSAPSAELLKGLLHEGTHVIRQPRGLRKYQRRLGPTTGHENHCLVQASKLLCQHFNEAQIAIAEIL